VKVVLEEEVLQEEKVQTEHQDVQKALVITRPRRPRRD
jgi:hypothetical protein